MKLSREHQELVREQIRGHLARSGSFGKLPASRRLALASDMAAVVASLIEDVDPTSAAGLIAEIDFPGFVSDLIQGTFQAVVDASIRQMEAYADLVRDVASELDGMTPGARRVADRLRPRLGAVAAWPGHVRIDLPTLHGTHALVPESIRAVAVIYLVHELETLGLFAVADRLVELFMQGQLPIGGRDAAALDAFTRTEPSRLTASERRAIHERVLGPGAGSSGGFDEHWRRFLADVAAAIAGAPDDPRPPSLLDPVRASGHALARLASERGGGVTQPAARVLGEHAKACLDLVALPSILAATGARDRWQVIERVGASYLGTSPPVMHHRERASAGAAVLGWIADHAAALATAPLALAGVAGPVARWLVTEAGDGAGTPG